ncbi:allantoate amidohydrolase [Vibrio hippocampi]|uniref:N-carbamoyl-L-amino acid hydrolase n=1 Tax=Vibrio hippocampi TaxID=654686 RepID=A0ABN8DJV6_9VIBR|nr:allantoate amidohydrolase [Vibrio hippocampi]CAH0529247.1 N-carbamoyl-L-amino acid hydrolase [Vibrio hippocampi]
MDHSKAFRIMQQADKLAEFTSMQGGLTRTYLSAQHKQAHQQLANWMTSAGLTTWQDSVGNQWGRKAASNLDAPILILGSHSDTVADAGKYDGNLGVLLAISALEQLQDVEFPFHIDVVAFADEEGTRFDTTLIGSSAVAGIFDPRWLAIEDGEQISMAQAMQTFGLDPQQAGKDRLACEKVLAYLEVHIEQGPVLEAADRAVGVVTGIAGAKRYQLSVKGMAGHAGTVPIGMRADAMCGAAQMTSAIEAYAKQHNLVATVGKCDVVSGSVNVIPGEVNFTLDIRSLEQDSLEKACDDLLTELSVIAEQRGLTFAHQLFYQAQAVPCSERLQQAWGDVVAKVTDKSVTFLPSGAGHDALAMAHLTEVGMLFVRCEKGISHHPLESVMQEDVAVALECTKQMLLAQLRAYGDQSDQ